MEGKDLFFKNGNSNINSLWSGQCALPFGNSISEENRWWRKRKVVLLPVMQFSSWIEPQNIPNLLLLVVMLVVVLRQGLTWPRKTWNLLCSQGWSWTPDPLCLLPKKCWDLKCTPSHLADLEDLRHVHIYWTTIGKILSMYLLKIMSHTISLLIKAIAINTAFSGFLAHLKLSTHSW